MIHSRDRTADPRLSRFPGGKIDQIHLGLLGRSATARELAAANDDRTSLIADIVSGREFMTAVLEPFARRTAFGDDRFAGTPTLATLQRLSTLLADDADMATATTWHDWLETLVRSDDLAGSNPAVARRYRELRGLEEERARAWTRVLRVADPLPDDPRAPRIRLLSSGLFDPDWYAARYPDTRHVDAADHYLLHGAAEGRQPSPIFNATAYLDQNPDVRHVGANPIFHWLDFGRREGRSSPFLDIHATELGLTLQDLCDPARDERPRIESDPDFMVSVLTPTFNTRPVWLRELYRTLANQIYGNWEWVVCDDASTDATTLATLHEIAAADPRVTVVALDRPGGIATATNAALALAGGTHVALVDHDDLLARDAFLEVWRSWRAAPGMRMFYTDECKLAADGTIYDVSLKPAWSPVLLESTMYVGHLTVYDRTVLDEVGLDGTGAFRSAFDGTQDFDLALRVSRLVDTACHVEVIGYLWRAVPGSTAYALDEKVWGVKRQVAAVRDHVRHLAPGAEVTAGFSPGFWQTTYALDRDPPRLSLVIPTGAGSRMVRGEQTDLLVNCISSMIEHDFYPNLEIVVVHNGDLSTRQQRYLDTIPGIRLIAYDEPTLNLARKINIGVEAASGDYVCLLNDDVEAVTPRGGEALVAFLQAHSRVAAIGPMCLYEDGRVQHNGVMLLEQGPAHSGIFQHPDFAGPFGYLRLRREAFGVTGAILIVARDRYREVGGFDERLPLNYNDVHFCQKLRARGWSCVVDPSVRVFHFESATKVGTFQCEKELFYRLSPAVTDPYFNAGYNQRNPYYHVPLLTRAGDGTPSSFESWLDRRIGDGRYDADAETDPEISFTVGVAVFNQPAALLREMLVSLEMQTYPHKEIVILDDGCTAPGTRAWLNTLSSHPSVTLLRHKTNRGIAGGMQTMLDATRNRYFLPVDCDDFLTADALSCMARAIAANPGGALFYSDEFKSDMSSQKFSPFFKPDFDPLMITNNCFVGHLMAFSVDVHRSVCAYDDDRATWCHDWDSTLRHLAAGHEPIHVPELLYAWRINPGSTASAESDEKPQAVGSQRFVLERYLARRGLGGRLSVKRNTLGSRTGMWALEAKAPLPHVRSLDARALWRADDVRQRLLAAADAKGTEWVALLAPDQDGRDVLRALGAPAILDPRIKVVGSNITAGGGTLLWSGGFFENGQVVDPTVGQVRSGGGYHGQLYCQRCVDVVAPVNVLIAADVLAQAIEASPENMTAADLMITLGLDAAQGGWYIATTPWAETRLRNDDRGLLPLDRRGRLQDEPLAQASRWRRWPDPAYLAARQTFGPC